MEAQRYEIIVNTL